MINLSNGQIEFTKIFNQIQNCSQFNEKVLKTFLYKIFEDLNLKLEKKNKDLISRKIFSLYLDLPIIVSNKIFNSFRDTKTNADFITKIEFVKGMYNLYFSDFENIKNSIFKIFDIENNGEIFIDNLKIILRYFNSQKDLKIKNLENFINQFFKKGKEFIIFMNIEQFSNKIKNTNSDLFIIILILLYYKQPFSEESLKFYQNNHYIENLLDIDEETIPSGLMSKYNSEYIIKPTNELNMYLKFLGKPYQGTKRKMASKDLLKYENKENVSLSISSSKNITEKNILESEMKINSLNNIIEEKFNRKQRSFKTEKLVIRKKLPEELKDLHTSFSNMYTKAPNKLIINKYMNDDNENKMTNYFYETVNFNFNPSCNYKIKIDSNQDILGDQIFITRSYQLNSQNKLTKYNLILIEKDLYVLNTNSNSDKFELKRIIPLQGYFVAKCDTAMIDKKVFYVFCLISKFGNSVVNVDNIFLMKNLEENELIRSKIKKSLNIKEINDYYEILNVLGKGQYGVVKLGKCKKTGEEVAIKIIKKSEIKEKEINIVRSELDVVQHIKNYSHPNIVKCFDIFEDRKFIFIVMEYLSGGSLNQFMIRKGKILSNEEIKKVSIQLIEAINFLHENGILHRDIKSDNIMLSKDNLENIKLVDFGLSTVLLVNEKAKESFGTLVHTPPEVLLKLPHNNKLDVWSFGILIFYLMTGSYPFDGDGLSMSDIANKICNEELIFPKNNDFNLKLKILVRECLIKSFKKRPEIKEFLNFFDNSDKSYWN